MCRLGPDIFMEKRGGNGGSSPAKKKTLAPLTPGPLTSLILDPPEPSGPPKQQQSQRGEGNSRAEKSEKVGKAKRGNNNIQKSQKKSQKEVI